MTEEENIRYNRQTILPEWGTETQEKVKASSVLVIGAGGLGCPVLSYLAAAGVGNITVMDFDVVDISNLQRQVIYDMNDVGKNKALSAVRKLQAFNTGINSVSIVKALDKRNALEVIANHDVVVDACDNFETRYLINDACVILNKPFVFASILGFEGQISTFNIKNGPTYRCLYPQPPENRSNCNDAGVIGALAGVMGCLQANETLKIITGVGETLSGKLLIVDLLHNKFSTLKIETVEANKHIISLGDYNTDCNNEPIRFISKKHFAEKFSGIPHMAIDVSDEHEYIPIEKEAQNIPLYEIEKHDFADAHVPIILYCKSGMRSRQAAMLLFQKGVANIYCLTS